MISKEPARPLANGGLSSLPCWLRANRAPYRFVQRCLQSMATGEILPGIGVAPRVQEESDLGCVLAGTHVFERSGAPRIPSEDGQSQFTAESDLVFGSHHLLRTHFPCQACPIGSRAAVSRHSPQHRHTGLPWGQSPYCGLRALACHLLGAGRSCGLSQPLLC